MSTVVALFRQYNNAERAFDELLANRFELNEISAIVPDTASKNRGSSDDRASGDTGAAVRPTVVAAGTSTPTPALLGTAGASIGLNGMVLPGVGSVRGGGPLFSTENPETVKASEASRGGSLADALVDHGIPEADAQVYAEGVHRGHVLLAVETDRIADAKSIMNQNNAADTTALAKAWDMEGWRPGQRS